MLSFILCARVSLDMCVLGRAKPTAAAAEARRDPRKRTRHASKNSPITPDLDAISKCILQPLNRPDVSFSFFFFSFSCSFSFAFAFSFSYSFSSSFSSFGCSFSVPLPLLFFLFFVRAFVLWFILRALDWSTHRLHWCHIVPFFCRSSLDGARAQWHFHRHHFSSS